MTKPVRLNTRVSAELNEWLDEESQKTGMTKSAIVANAVEQARMQKVYIQSMPKINELAEFAKEAKKEG